MDAERMYQLCEPIQALSPADRRLVSAALMESEHMVEESMGDDPKARAAAYEALGKMVAEMGQ